MTNKLIARFDDLGIYELQDPRLLDVVSTTEIEAVAAGTFDAFCTETNGVCGSDTVCGNPFCFNNLCYDEPFNAACNTTVNTVC